MFVPEGKKTTSLSLHECEFKPGYWQHFILLEYQLETLRRVNNIHLQPTTVKVVHISAIAMRYLDEEIIVSTCLYMLHDHKELLKDHQPRKITVILWHYLELVMKENHWKALIHFLTSQHPLAVEHICYKHWYHCENILRDQYASYKNSRGSHKKVQASGNKVGFTVEQEPSEIHQSFHLFSRGISPLKTREFHEGAVIFTRVKITRVWGEIHEPKKKNSSTTELTIPANKWYIELYIFISLQKLRDLVVPLQVEQPTTDELRQKYSVKIMRLAEM
ncbi:hypothetical protein C8R44DRAFT_735365 [Mycena epipterygia]|nr:hypothetical protein C8R44DRAFT_735365 [Mycena epipterygia]